MEKVPSVGIGGREGGVKPYGQPDRKISVFTISLNENNFFLLWQIFMHTHLTIMTRLSFPQGLLQRSGFVGTHSPYWITSKLKESH